MPEPKTIVIDRFDEGMTNDARGRGAVARIVKHLDTYTEPSAFSVLPDNDATTADRAATTFDNVRIQQFVYANFLATPTFYGLGVQTGTQKPEIYYKTSVADGTAWTASNHTGDFAALTALGGVGLAGPVAFVLYHEASAVYLYGIDAGGWWKYGDLTGTPTWTRVVYTATILNLVPPIVHSKDDIMYSAGGQGTLVANRIIRNTVGTWDDALTFGIYNYITSICEYGNYLAIGANLPNGTCTVYLWDRDSSLAGISEKIDWGTGQLKWIDVVGGTLVGCIIQEPSGLSISPNVVFKYYNGAEAVKFAEFTCSSATIQPYKQRFNNRVLFLASMTINGTTLAGTWRVMKSSSGLSVSFDQQPRLDDAASALYGFLQTGDYTHIACNVSEYLVTKTGATYATTTSYETSINPSMPEAHRPLKKALVSVAATYDPLPASTGVIFQYKVDGGSWIDVFNDTTDGSVVMEMVKANTDATSNGTTYSEFTAGRDYEFRVKPNGNVKVTGIIYKYKTLQTLI